MGPTRRVKEADVPKVKVPLRLCSQRLGLKKLDFSAEFVMYLGCYVLPDQLAFAPVKELRWAVRVQGTVVYDASDNPTFVPGPHASVHADAATDPTDSPILSEPLPKDAIAFPIACP